jgi:DNA-directed RNA polymerase subunit omega
MARITSQRAVEASGGNRYMMVLMASQRAREITRGSRPKLESKNGPVITAIREIEEGLYTEKDYLNSLPSKKKGLRDEHFPT